MNATHLTPEVEQRWLELRQHLDWSEGFSLVFYFSDNLATMEKLRQRVEKYYLGRSTKLKIINYERRDDWMERTLKSLLPRKSINEPIWLELNRDDSELAQNSYSQLMLRLNERRDQLRRDLNQTLFIILPFHYLAVCRESVPDLWGVRALSEVIE
ncbi:MAG TPA: hypothetical protein ENJ07_02945 [Gammaproteobacteria bacterium]|nr:hypothetical protein [Gammaproteobacteria bacterium]